MFHLVELFFRSDVDDGWLAAIPAEQLHQILGRDRFQLGMIDAAGELALAVDVDVDDSLFT